MTERMTAVAHAEAMATYAEAGLKRAAALGNRGPLRLGPDGRLVSEEILDAYERTGFYVFENVIDEAELAALRGELEGLLERAPVDNGAKVDRRGRPAYGQEFARPVFSLIRPLVDPGAGPPPSAAAIPSKWPSRPSSMRLPPRSCFS